MRRSGVRLLDLEPAVRDVEAQIEHWRKTRSRLAPMPEHLWQSAVAVARLNGTSRVAVALRIDYKGLRRRVDAAGGVKVADAQFVEVAAAGDLPEQRDGLIVVKLERSDGATMCVHLSTEDALIRLTESFWGRSR